MNFKNGETTDFDYISSLPKIHFSLVVSIPLSAILSLDTPLFSYQSIYPDKTVFESICPSIICSTHLSPDFRAKMAAHTLVLVRHGESECNKVVFSPYLPEPEKPGAGIWGRIWSQNDYTFFGSTKIPTKYLLI